VNLPLLTPVHRAGPRPRRSSARAFDRQRGAQRGRAPCALRASRSRSTPMRY
jgi:hypothetical protein